MSDAVLTTRILSMTLALDAAWPAWTIALAGGAVIALAWWTYRSAAQHSTRAKILAALRAVAALLLVLVLARPTLILSRELRPRSALTLAIDTSASMARSDIAPAGMAGSDISSGASAATDIASGGVVLRGPERSSGAEQGPADRQAQPQTRLSAVVGQLADKQGALLRQLAQRYQVLLTAVSDRVVSRFTLDSPGQVPHALAWLKDLKAEGPRTDLAAGVQEILATAEADRTLAGVVLLSDGRRSAGAPLTGLAEPLHASRCPAIAVPAGSDASLPDLRLADVQVPPRVFVGEPAAIRGRLEGSGLPSAVGARLKLIDESTGGPIADRAVSVDPATGQAGDFALMYRPDKPGLARLVLRADSPLPEVNLRNNEIQLQVEAVTAQIRVLYVERDARFEYRYLKNLLIREPSVISSVLLLSADPEFPQEGTEPIRRFPTSLQELDRYDVVLLGDVDPKTGWIDAPGLETLAKWVEQNGGGLGWMPGSRVSLQAWRDTPLGKVLPVKPTESGAAQSAAEPYRLLLTPEGAKSSIFFLDANNVPAEQVIASLPEWYGSAIPALATPAAQALAVHPRLRTPEGPVPLVVTGHYGAGQTFYCASDEMWRWRRFRDIEHWRAFWLQTVRWLAGPRKLGAYRKVVLEATPSKVQAGQPVNFDLRVHDETLAGDLPERLGATIRGQDGAAQNLWLQRPAGLAAYTGSIAPDRAGTYTAEVRLPATTQPATATFTVQLPEAETADSPADSAALKQWVQAVEQAGGQGYVLELSKLGELASLPLPAAQSRRRTMDLRLWDNWLALLLVAGLFLAEWAWRRARGMA